MLSCNTINYKARLIHLITGIDEEALKRAKYTSEELKISNKENKVYKTDIIVSVENNIISLEMNAYYYEKLVIKNSMYSSKILSDELNKGEDYLDLKGVIQINIDDYHVYKGKKKIYEFMMREETTQEVENEYYKSYHINTRIRDAKEEGLEEGKKNTK